MSAGLHATLPDGRRPAVRVDTDYPAGGTVRVRVLSDEPKAWTLSLRVPSWATGATLTDGGRTRPVSPGTARVHRAFHAGDLVVLDLPMRPRFTFPDPRIDAVRGCVAVESGPDVLCVETHDLPDPDRLNGLVVDAATEPREGGPATLVRARLTADDDRGWPYGPLSSAPAEDDRWFDLPMRPYRSWARRGPAGMRVWLPVAGGA